jgi:crotonobetainyl-CoA:carnitine CoA-transferase CaiB-like acyl-CoA transferase
MDPDAPLHGIRVVELARILAGPWIGQTLADLGADVVKIESPEGDETRRWGPPFVTATNGNTLDAAYFHCCNRGKRSVVADFRIEQDLTLVRRLIERADIVIENFKTGALEKFGLDYQTLREQHPRLIYCSVTGFGQTGPYATWPGYDAVIQGMSGIMDITGDLAGDPQKIGVALADILTGVYGVVGIQAALLHRQRTGLGTQVDMALLDVMVGVLANQALNYLVSGATPRRMGNAHPNIVPYQAFSVRDGFVTIAVGTDSQFVSFCCVLRRTDLIDSDLYRTNADRVKNRESLIEILSSELRVRTRDELLTQLATAGVPSGPINTVEEALSNPQILARQMRLQFPTPNVAGGHLPGLRTPIRFSRLSLSLKCPAPRLGEHTQAIGKELDNSG